MPRCPVSTDYLAEPETIASFRLLPGEYKWSAESIPANLSMLPLMSDSSIRFWLTPRKDSGKLYVKQGETCLLQSIIF
jgi:hypothetical protein